MNLTVFDAIITDRGSRYAVSGGPATSRAEAQAAVTSLKKNKRFAKATHNTWGVILSDGGPQKNDDGETGAGMVILRMLEREQLFDHVIIVTRWFGGTQLGGDRFRRVQDSGRHYLESRPPKMKPGDRP
ncbi:MAG: YigZ family protein [Alphaproteobacteria bacterium]|nr:YigZ family protein [Alphaproteobacteria bacterium]